MQLPIYTPPVEKHHRICRLVCLLASQLMASWGCATALPQESFAQPAVTAVPKADVDAQPASSHDVDADEEAEGPDASDATEPVHEGPEAPVGDRASATEHLGRAFGLFRNSHHQAAARQFQAAIDSGELNDAGRSLAYWHIAAAHQATGAAAAAQDALESFIVVSVDLLTDRLQGNAADAGSDDFIQRFDLVRRVARARAELSVAWTEHTQTFGRSAGSPVPVHSVAEINYFLELAPPCPPGQPRKAYEASSHAKGHAPGVSEIQLTCDDGRVQAQYYFVAVDGN